MRQFMKNIDWNNLALEQQIMSNLTSLEQLSEQANQANQAKKEGASTN